MANESNNESIKDVVKARYGEAAKRVVQNSGGKTAEGAPSECGCSTAAIPCCDPISGNLYATNEVAGLPADAVAASLGCGNPTALAQLNAGETVLDLGSGGGIDVLLSAKRVGVNGKSVRSRHDGRDAGAGAREPAKGGSGERGISERRDRKHTAAGKFGGCGDFELRDQFIGRQRPRVARSIPRAAAETDDSRFPMWWCAVQYLPRFGGAWSCGWVAWPALSKNRNTGRSSRRRDLKISKSSRRASTAWRMRGNSLRRRASMWMRWRRTWKASSRARSYERKSQRSQKAVRNSRAANRPVAQRRSDRDDWTLQRTLPLYGQFGAVDHGRSDSQPERPA